MKIKSLIAILAVSAINFGCGSIENRSVSRISEAALNEPGQGIILLSSGAPEHCISTSTFLKVFQLSTQTVAEGSHLIPVDGYSTKSEFADHQGTVSAFSLPAGSYYLSPWIANPYVKPIKTPRFEFDVIAGETTYIGELFMPQSCQFNTIFAIRDQYDRDLPIAIAKNSLLQQRPAVKRLMHGMAPENIQY